ncbi:unnamed protein product [Auanema sp. JU1783]|nr:unnamed protein product [Auanema sp. JU1783]
MDKQSSESGIDTMHGSSDTGSSCYQSYTEMTAEQEFFLYELETTDSNSMGLVLRAIYDCGDVNKFTRALEHRIQQYNKNIERVCTFHYKEFVESMKVLLELRKQCDDIKVSDDYVMNDIHILNVLE